MRFDGRKASRVKMDNRQPVNLMGSDGTWRRSCVLLDVSNSGAKIEVEGTLDVLQAKEFFMVLSSTGLAYRRCDGAGREVAVVCNFTPVPRQGYRVGMQRAGQWSEIVNTDSEIYGGSNVGNGGVAVTEDVASHGKPQSLVLTLPPLATIVLRAS